MQQLHTFSTREQHLTGKSSKRKLFLSCNTNRFLNSNHKTKVTSHQGGDAEYLICQLAHVHPQDNSTHGCGSLHSNVLFFPSVHINHIVYFTARYLDLVLLVSPILLIAKTCQTKIGFNTSYIINKEIAINCCEETS